MLTAQCPICGVFAGECEEKCFWSVRHVVWYLFTNVSIFKVDDTFNIIITQCPHSMKQSPS